MTPDQLPRAWWRDDGEVWAGQDHVAKAAATRSWNGSQAENGDGRLARRRAGYGSRVRAWTCCGRTIVKWQRSSVAIEVTRVELRFIRGMRANDPEVGLQPMASVRSLLERGGGYVRPELGTRLCPAGRGFELGAGAVGR